MKKILIVDDEPIIRMVTTRALSNRYEIISAGSGREALGILQETVPDMVISDVMMPGMSGYELLEQVRVCCGPDMPFLFMTGDESDGSMERGLESGATGIIRKPVTPDAVRETVDSVFARVSGGLAQEQQASVSCPEGQEQI